MKAIRISYKVYFTDEEVLIKTSPAHILSRDFVFSDRKSFVNERFAFEKLVVDFRHSLEKLYKLVYVDKTISYFDLDSNDF